MLTPLLGAPGLGWPELLIILAVVLILFGGSRLAGLGKSTGRALREFKEETKGMTGGDKKDAGAPQSDTTPQVAPPAQSTTPVEPTVQDPQTSSEPRRDV